MNTGFTVGVVSGELHKCSLFRRWKLKVLDAVQESEREDVVVIKDSRHRNPTAEKNQQEEGIKQRKWISWQEEAHRITQ